jgi:starch-binding outer membrane protein, SusD/RagB family
MKKLSILIVAILAILLFASCEDWLKESPRSSITAANFYVTEADAQAAVNAIYAFLYGPYGKGGYDDMPYAMLELVTGQFVNQAQSSISAEFAKLNYSSSSPYISSWFNSSYRGIEAANIALANIPNITMGEQTKSRLLGEAKFLRAYYYYILVNVFGEVPIKLKPTAKPGDELLPKSSIKEIYETVIVPDLKDAETAPLSDTPQGSGRVSKGAAKSLLAKVYLSMAGLPLNQSDKYALARDKAAEVINSNWFSLFQTDGSLTWFNKLNNPDFDNTQEHIFSINYGLALNESSFSVFFLPKEKTFVRNKYIQFGGFYPSDSFLNSYDAADLRGKNNQGFYYNSIVVDGTTYTFPWAMYKFFDAKILDIAPRSGKDFPVIRYADILLVYAEAQNEADGSANSKAYDAVKKIRDRAGVPPLANGLSKDQFREAVWKERYWELAAESKTWFDMVRTNKAYNATTNSFVNLVGYTLPNGAVFKSQNLKFPIPEREVQINPLLGN